MMRNDDIRCAEDHVRRSNRPTESASVFLLGAVLDFPTHKLHIEINAQEKNGRKKWIEDHIYEWMMRKSHVKSPMHLM